VDTSELQAHLESWLVPDESVALTDAERAAIERGLEVIRAANLDHVPTPEPVKKAKRKTGRASS
jgi:hypothetical protein